MKALKWILWIGGGLAFLAIVAVAIVAATFDPNQYKPQIVDLVKQRTGRTLTMDGRGRRAQRPLPASTQRGSRSRCGRCSRSR